MSHIHVKVVISYLSESAEKSNLLNTKLLYAICLIEILYLMATYSWFAFDISRLTTIIRYFYL